MYVQWLEWYGLQNIGIVISNYQTKLDRVDKKQLYIKRINQLKYQTTRMHFVIMVFGLTHTV